MNIRGKTLGTSARITAASAALCCVGLASASGTWQPNETQVSAQQDLIDPEFSQSRGMFVWNDETGNLWLGYVDRATGNFMPPDGKAILVDPDAMRFEDAQSTYNGPEWAMSSIGDVIVYTKYAGWHTDGNARLGYAYMHPDGSWVGGFLGPDLARKAPYGSSTEGDPAPRITYVDKRENHYWRDIWNPGSEAPLPDFPPSNYPVQHVRGARALLYPLTVNSISQVFYRDLDTGTVEQLTFDAGQKYQMFMWKAPEFNDDFVFMTLVDEVKLRVYRKLPDPQSGSLRWTPIVEHAAPRGATLYSPEPFTYDGKSYVFMALALRQYQFRSEIWIANIDQASPIFRRISDDSLIRTRTDPEVFITDRGPMIYYNRLVPEVDRRGKLKPCLKISCSEGVWRADPGLGSP